MKYFKLVKENVDTRPFLDEIAAFPGGWDAFTGRQQKIKVQRESKAIPIRGLVKSKIRGRRRRDVHESRITTSAGYFPHAVSFIEAYAAEQNAELGRAKLVNLPPGCRVFRHIDRGDYYFIRARHHLVLQSPKGSFLTCGDEEVRMQPGEFWWFDNNAPHESINDSDVGRIHLIFDLLLPEIND